MQYPSSILLPSPCLVISHARAHRHIIPSVLPLQLAVQWYRIAWLAKHHSLYISGFLKIPASCAQLLWAFQPCVVGLVSWGAPLLRSSGQNFIGREMSVLQNGLIGQNHSLSSQVEFGMIDWLICFAKNLNKVQCLYKSPVLFQIWRTLS